MLRFYFDFATWRKLKALVAGIPDGKRRRSLQRLMGRTVPLRAAGHAICYFLDGILFPGIWRVKVKAPVFVIGHARSGTTLAHRLLCLDPRFSAFKYWELRLPALLEKKVVHLLAWADSHLFGRRMARRLEAWEERVFGPTRHIHKMGLDMPEEDDLVFYDSCASGFWMTNLPFMGDVDFFHIDRRPPAARRRLMGFYRDCVRRQLYLNGRDKTHLSKNPSWCGRIESILEVFPDARFVVLYRNPYETIPSLLKLLSVSWKNRGNVDQDKIRESIRAMVALSYETYLYPLEALARHPGTPQAVVDYRKLVAQPKAAVEQIYADLGIEMTDAVRQLLQHEQERARKHETEHRYSLAEFGLDDAEIRRTLAPLFERFDWDAEPAQAPPAGTTQ
jgi:hypothetical protein